MINVNTLARRGLEAYHNVVASDSSDDGSGKKPDEIQVSPWAFFVLALTMMAFSFLAFAISYTYGHLITTLCMVESSSTDAYVPIATVAQDEEDENPPGYTETNNDSAPRRGDIEVDLVRTKPITTSIRATLVHLRAKCGYLSRFRGLSVYVVWVVLRGFLVAFFSAASRNGFGVALGAVLAEVALAHVHMTWIHVIISEPSSKRWYERIPRPAFRTWKKIAPAVTLWAVTSQVVNIVPMLVASSFGCLKRLNDPQYRPGMKDAYGTAGQMFFLMLLTLTLLVLLQIPATVTMVRVAASMLPEEDETIVPFDRTFGGLTTPEIVGGQGKIGIVEAWRSFDWECRRRLLRTVAKVAAIAVSIWFLMTVVIMAEAHLLFGDKFGEIMKGVHDISRSSR